MTELSPEGMVISRQELPSAKPRTWLRLILALALVVSLVLVGKWTGVTDDLSAERVRQMIDDAGAYGIVVFVAIFCVGELIQIPGLIFVAAGVYAYGQGLGGVISYLTAIASVVMSFVIVRLVGGQALRGIDKPWVKKILDGIDRQPIATVAVLRLVFIMSPPLNYALALSSIRFRDYLLGSALGLILPIGLFVILFDWAVKIFVENG